MKMESMRGGKSNLGKPYLFNNINTVRIGR